MSTVALDASTLPPAGAGSPDSARLNRSAADGGELTFDDVIDIINPLQHLPIVSTIYRAITGDQISPHARAIGAGLYGGPAGALSAGAAMAAEQALGTTAEDTLAGFFADDAPGDAVAALPDAPGSPPASLTPALPAVVPTPPATVAPAAAAPTPPPKAATVSSPPTVAAATSAPDPAPAPTLPFTAKDRPRMFALPGAEARRISLVPAEPDIAKADRPEPAVQAQVPTPTLAAGPLPTAAEPGPLAGVTSLSSAQGALLDRFIAGGVQTLGPTTPDAAGASAEWFAHQMQTNLQKYAEAQRTADRLAAR